VTQQPRRARDLGIAPGRHAPGPLNAITDVPGVRVGHVTLHREPGIRTGVTAIVPDLVDRAGGQLPAGLFTANGFGKLTGSTQLAETGVLETPIVLTGTLSVFRAADALVSYVLDLPGNEQVQSVNAVAGETNDGFLSDIRARPVTPGDVRAALAGAQGGPVAEGAVGAGTGTGALGFKAGIGTSSRVATLASGAPVTVGVLLQANFSGTLTVLGVPIPAPAALAELTDRPPASPPTSSGEPESADGPESAEPRGNSCVIIVAVDRGLDSRQLGRVARRAIFGLARAGSDFAGGSGDYALAFAATDTGEPVADRELDPVFTAVQEAVEEAVLNSVLMATTTRGHGGHVRQACPHEYVLRACRAAGVLPAG
jgi:D-aminopeptidase